MGSQARVVYRPSHREVVEHLEAITLKPEDAMGQVVEKAPDPRAANPGCLRLEVEYLANDTRLPVQSAVEPGTEGLDRLAILSKHCDGKCTVRRDRLVATRLLGCAAGVPPLKKEERQGTRAPIRSVPQEAWLHRTPERVFACRVAQQHIESGRQVRNTVDEEQEVDTRTPWQGSERDLVGPWHRLQKNLIEPLSRDAGASVERNSAAPLMDYAAKRKGRLTQLEGVIAVAERRPEVVAGRHILLRGSGHLIDGRPIVVVLAEHVPSPHPARGAESSDAIGLEPEAPLHPGLQAAILRAHGYQPAGVPGLSAGRKVGAQAV